MIDLLRLGRKDDDDEVGIIGCDLVKLSVLAVFEYLEFIYVKIFIYSIKNKEKTKTHLNFSIKVMS